jgi:hypothetical protein
MIKAKQGGKRRFCGMFGWPHRGESCTGQTVYLSTHVSVCPECGTLWWWKPASRNSMRVLIPHEWRNVFDERTARDMAYELASTILPYDEQRTLRRNGA